MRYAPLSLNDLDQWAGLLAVSFGRTTAETRAAPLVTRRSSHHRLASPPNAQLRENLHNIGFPKDWRYSRVPYYRTARALGEGTSPQLFDFVHWDYTGGDIL